MDGGSEVEHQLGAGAPGYADEDAVLRRVLAACEHGVAVLGPACQHARLAGAAQAFAAGVVHIDAAVEQHLEDGLVGRDVEAAVLALELHAEAAGRRLGCRGRRRRAEPLHVHALIRQALRGAAEGLQHGHRAAAVEVGACGRLPHERREVQPGRAGQAVHDRHHAARCAGWCQRLQRLGEGCAAGRAHAVVQRPGPAQPRKPTRHGQHGRDADAAGHQHAQRRGLVERKVVARRGNAQQGAGTHLVVQRRRSAAAGRVAAHADHVAVPLLGVVAERVLAQQRPGGGRDLNVDVAAGREGRQRAAVRSAQLEGQHVQRLGPHGVHAHRQPGGFGGHQKR